MISSCNDDDGPLSGFTLSVATAASGSGGGTGVTSSEIRPDLHLQLTGLKNTLKDPGWHSKTSIAGVWLGFSSDYNWSNSAIKSQSLPPEERLRTQRSLISRTLSLQISVSSEGTYALHVPRYIPDSLHSHLLPLSLTNSHSAQNLFLFVN